MKTSHLLFAAALLVSGPLIAQSQASSIVATSVQTDATITLGPAIYTFAPLPPRAPYTFQEGTHLKIVVPVNGVTNPTVTWYKGSKKLDVTGNVLEIASATAADSGQYSASFVSTDKPPVQFTSDTANVLISRGGQRLLNLSTRTRIDTAGASAISGFIVEPGPSQTVLLVRAVGPALAQFGLSGVLASPKLKLMDSQGREIQPVAMTPVEGVMPYISVDDATQKVGAFPLPSGGKDVAQLYYLGAGAYTANVTSADNGTGTVLLEIYEVPMLPAQLGTGT